MRGVPMANTKPATGKRVFFTQDDTNLAIPSLIAHQKDSWREFVETGLSEIFAELNPIEDYTGQKLELRFKEYKFHDPKVSEVETKENNLTFDAPLHVNVELTNKVTGEVKEQEIYLGDYPWIITKVNLLFFDFTSYFVCQFDVHMKRRIKCQIVFFGFDLGDFGIMKLVFFEAQFEFLTGVVLDWVKFCKNLAQTSFDEFTPAVFLVSDETCHWYSSHELHCFSELARRFTQPGSVHLCCQQK